MTLRTRAAGRPGSPDPIAVAASISWSGAAPDLLHWLHGDGEHVVFSEASGQTHLLDDLGAQILITLTELGRMSFSELIVDLGQDLAESELHSLPAMTAERLWQLDQLGLVHRT